MQLISTPSGTDEAREARARRKLGKDGLAVRRLRGNGPRSGLYAVYHVSTNTWDVSPDYALTLDELERYADEEAAEA